MARKTEFELEDDLPYESIVGGCKVSIGRNLPDGKPHVLINIRGERLYIKDRDLERFAVNILKALNSPKLKK